MYFNNYVQIFLYVPQVLILFSLALFSPKSSYSRLLKSYIGALFIVTVAGILIGLYRGLTLSKDYSEIREDISKLVSFVLFIVMPFFFFSLNKKYKIFLCKWFNIFAVTYTFAVLPNMFIVVSDGSIYPGNLFGRTTVNITIISAWLFYSLSMFYINRERWLLVWSFVCYLIVLASLAKWNFIAILLYPLLVFLVALKGVRSLSKLKKKRTKVIFICSIVFLGLNISTFGDIFSRNLGYESFEHYLEKRVLGDPNNNGNLARTAFNLTSDKGVRDGARLMMWADLISRTMESPILGTGLGSRALEDIGLQMEDHNIFVTHMSRYGVPLFCLWFFLVGRILKIQYSHLNRHVNLKPVRAFYVIIFLNFTFQSSVGNIWGQLLVALFVGSSVGIFLNSAHAYGNSLTK